MYSQKKNDINTIFPNIFLFQVLFSLFCYVLIYFFELSHFTLSIDEEPLSNYIHTIANGRWGDALLKRFLFPEPYIPYFTQLLAFFIMSISSSFVCSFFKFTIKQSIIFILASCCLPQFAFQLQYTQQVDTYAFGYLMSVLSTILLFSENNKKILMVVSCLFISFSLGIYQSLLLVSISIYLYKCYVDNLSYRDFFKVSLKFFIASVFGFLLYSFISKLFMNHYHVNDLGYFSEKIAWTHKGFLCTFRETVHEIKLYFLGKGIYSLEVYFISIPLLIIINIKNFLKKFYFNIVISILIAFSPFLFNMISGGFQPPRVLASLPYSFAFLFVISFEEIGFTISILLLFFLCIIATAKVSKLFYADYMRHEQDLVFSTRILSSIYQKYPNFDQEKNLIYFYGSPNLPNTISFDKNTDSFNMSWFNMFDGSSIRITNFMRYIGIANFRTIDNTQAKDMISFIKTIPIYPKNGSIVYINEKNVLIVKLGAEMGH